MCRLNLQNLDRNNTSRNIKIFNIILSLGFYFVFKTSRMI